MAARFRAPEHIERSTEFRSSLLRLCPAPTPASFDLRTIIAHARGIELAQLVNEPIEKGMAPIETAQ